MDKIAKYLKSMEEDIEEDIESLTAKDRINVYMLMKEFQLPKLQRAGYQTGDDKVDEITVTYINKEELERRRDESGD